MPEDFGGAVALMGDTGGEASTAVDTMEPGPEITTGEEGSETTGKELAVREPAEVEPARQDGTAPKSIAQALAPLKAASPEYYKQVNQAIGTHQRLAREVGPKPFEAIKTFKSVYESIGGEDGLRNIRVALDDIENLDRLYAAADPKVVDQLTSDEDGKAALPKLLPAILSKVASLDQHSYAQDVLRAFDQLSDVDANAWNGYMARTFLRHAQISGMDVAVRNLAALVPADNEQGKQYAKVFDKFLSDLAQTATLEPKPRPAVTAPDPRIQQLERERDEAQRKSKELEVSTWDTAARQPFNTVVSTEFNKLTKDRKMTPTQKESIGMLIDQRFAVARRGEFENTLSQFREKGDKNGYLSYTKGFFQKRAAEWVRLAVNDVLGAPGKAPIKQVTATPGQPAAARTQTQQPSNGQWVKGPPPDPAQVALSDPRTNLRAKHAVMLDGSFRTW